MKKALIFPIILVLFGAILFAANHLYYASDDYAYGIACDAVRANLKGPGAAVFAPASAAKYSRGTNTVQITSYVDGQNAFGGPVRMHWMVSLPRLANRYGTPTFTPIPDDE